MVARIRGSRWSGVFLGALVASLVLTAAPVIAETGDPLIQGRFNQVSRKTTLSGSVPGDATFKIVNTDGTGVGLNIQVAKGTAPMKVNSSKKVKKLNADKLDGYNSTDLMPGGVVPQGATLRGQWAVGSDSDYSWGGISFGYEFSSPLVAHWMPQTASPSPECPGSAANPEAAEGHLCVYEASSNDYGNTDMWIFDAELSGAYTYTYGAAFYAQNNAGGGEFWTYGTWAATAGAPGAGAAATPAVNDDEPPHGQ